LDVAKLNRELAGTEPETAAKLEVSH
jgi:hypothetical protein